MEESQRFTSKTYQKNKEDIRQRVKMSLFRSYPTNPQENKQKFAQQKELIEQFTQHQYEPTKEEIKSGIFYLKNNFSDYFIEENILGEGTVAIVKKVRSVTTNKLYACKIVKTKDDETIFNIKFEFLNMKKLSHPCIIKVEQLFIDQFIGKVYTIMELVNAPEMFITIQNIGTYSEAKARDIFKKILEGIYYLHSHGVCHRDLKPNNILCDASYFQICYLFSYEKLVKIQKLLISMFQNFVRITKQTSVNIFR